LVVSESKTGLFCVLPTGTFKLMAAHPHYDDAVIGAGILGLAHAYQLARRGRRVIVFERDRRACGASVRNLGMLWPIGQPFGPRRSLASRSLQIWLGVLASSGLWHEQTGSLHLAYRDDEAQVLREFAQECLENGVPVDLLGPAQVGDLAPAVKRAGLQLALFSPCEVCVEPRAVSAQLPDWLARAFGVVFHFGCTITAVEMPELVAGRTRWTAGRLWICCGDELRLLFPEQFQECGLVRCKLQMMRSQSCGGQFQIGPMLATGLTLRHYDSFRNCPTLAALKWRIAQESPWLDRFGIHVLVSQNGHGELTIGDSHEYDDAIEPFDKTEIDQLILGYLESFLLVPKLRIASRWHGTYVKHSRDPYLVIHPALGATAITGVGGAGMTLAFGLAEQVVARELGESDL
jgi:D-hydroxyproline dehydrogenase subunit beta